MDNQGGDQFEGDTVQAENGGVVIDIPSIKASKKDIIENDFEIDSAPQIDTPQTNTYSTSPHDHNGIDAPRVRENNILERRERIHVHLFGASPATAANYGVVFTALDRCFVRAVYERHATAGSDGGAVTLNVEKLTGTTAPDSGTVILSTAINLKGTANTLVSAPLVTTRATRTLKKGDALCLKDAGTLTAVAGVYVLIEVEYLI